MALSNSIWLLKPQEIYVDRDKRQRKQISTKNLVESIKLRGIINPLIVQQREISGELRWTLIAGERRLSAALELELSEVPCRNWEELDQIETQIIELEENLKRQDLHWRDQVSAIAKIHELYCEQTPGHSLKNTADSIGLSVSYISIVLRIWRDFDDPKVKDAGQIREAYNFLVRKDSREEENKAQELMDAIDGAEISVTPVTEIYPGVSNTDTNNIPVTPLKLYVPPVVSDPSKFILHESFLHWAPKYSGNKFNLLHCDFPYGLDGLFAGAQMQGSGHQYADSPEIYIKLLECLCINLDKFTSQSAHLLFWYSEKNGAITRKIFQELAPTWVFQPFPLVWVKSDNHGIAAVAGQSPRHIYETCLMGTRGRRNIVRVVSDAYSAPRDPRLHVSAKPVSVLKHFMTMLVDKNTSLLDPTCGSGNALQAAEALGAGNVLGLEIDETQCGIARQALRASRTLKVATQTLGT